MTPDERPRLEKQPTRHTHSFAQGYNAREKAKQRLSHLSSLLGEDWCDLDSASWSQLLDGIEGVGDGSEEEKKLREVGKVLKDAVKGRIREMMRIS